MSYENKGSMTAVAVVTAAPDRSGNFVIETGADPAVTIEAAWSYLNTLGGGTLVLKGAGQTWTLATQIDSQGDHVTVISDHGLLLASTGAFYMISVTHDDVKIDGLRMSMTTATARQQLMINFVGVGDAVVENCHLTGPDLERVAGDGFGIYFEDVLGGWIENNRIYTPQEAGIRLNQCRESTYGSGVIIIAGNIVSGARYHSTQVQRCDNINVVDNEFIGRDESTHDSVHISYDCYNIAVSGNICRYGGNGIALAGTGGGSWSCYYAKIEGNVISYMSINSIYIQDAYHVDVTDNIVDNQRGNTQDIIIGGDVKSEFINVDGNVIYGAAGDSRYHIAVLVGDHVNITNNTIHSDRVEGFGIWLYEGNDFLVSGNRITGKEIGVAIGQDGNFPSDIIVSDNHITCGGRVLNAYGVWILGDRVKVQDNHIDMNSVAQSIGVFVAGNGDDCTIQNNTIINAVDGVHVDDGDDIMFTGNRLEGNTTGLDIANAACVSIWVDSNSFEGCTTDVVDGAVATTPMYGSNVDENGARVADGVAV